jgi:hypothetical protein
MPLDFPNPAVSPTYTDSTSGNTYTFANGSWSLTSILSATKGGTGFASYNLGDILFGNASGTLSKLGAGSAGSVLSTNGNGADPTWILMSAGGGGAGTVASPGSLGKIAYYASTGASVKDATGLDYSASTNILTITSQNTTDVVLQLKGLSSSQTGSALVYKKDGTSNSFVVDKDGYVSTGEWRSTVVSPTYGGTGQATYTDGQLLIGNSSGTTLTKSTLTAGIGISIVNGNGSITINNFRPVVLNMASGFTPVGIGTDYNILRVPEGKNNTNASYNIRKVVMGVGTTSSGTSTIRVEKSTGPHTSTSGFNLSSTGSTWNSMSADLSLLGGLGETSWVTFTSGYGTAATGDRIRLNFTAVDSTHANFIVQMLLEEY